jgi:uncharacterized radical SAM superfamily Fe-S cluster-containing enzyme
MDAIYSASDVTFLNKTQSVCPVCLRRLDAERVAEGNNVYLRKECPEHGSFRTILWRGLESWRAWGAAAKSAVRSAEGSGVSGPGCPFVCGLCPEHHQQTCCVVLEVTARCNLACPVCFAAASPARAEEPEFDAIASHCAALRSQAGAVNLQISGGEPTVRDDLPRIVALASAQFPFVQLNTNGLRLARDPGYARVLREAGLGCVFLQFDGLTSHVYRTIRGRDLLHAKLAAIHNCGEARLGVVLVPTLVPGVNTGQIGEILNFAMQHMPTVRAVHFQPISYFGRYPAEPRDRDRITIPEVLAGIEEQTGGAFRAADFRPPTAENAYCSFQGRFRIAEPGAVEPMPPPAQASCCGTTAGDGLVQLGGDGARRSRQYVARQWAHPGGGGSAGCCGDAETTSFDQFLAGTARVLSVSGMAFQDAWNLDLERLRDCFLHAFDDEHRLIPLCAWNLTAMNGAPLYRGHGEAKR